MAVLALKRSIRTTLEPRMKQDYEQNVAGPGECDAKTGAEVAAQMEPLPSYQLWASANRAAQDRMWSLLASQIDQDYSRISRRAEQCADSASGSVALSDADSFPDYTLQANIHGQPGGYLLDRGGNDLAAGILYEAGGNLYAMGQGIGSKDSKGERLVAHIRENYPGFQPQRILEMGCSAGGQSTDYPAAFPDADFHAIDVSPGMLRYAHARAEALGAPVSFHQADAASTPFESDSFDLVISHNMFHEVAAGHMPRIMAECHRVLKPGGVCIHQDVPIQSHRFDAWMQFISEWQKDHNDEPFWLDFANADLPAMLAQAGFAKDNINETYLEAIDGPIPWYVVSAFKKV